MMIRVLAARRSFASLVHHRQSSSSSSSLVLSSSSSSSSSKQRMANVVAYASAAAAATLYLYDNHNNTLNTTHCMGGGLMIKIPSCKLKQAQQEQQTATFNIKDHYTIQRVLGRGAFGQVYKAQQRQAPHQTVALKAMNRAQTSAQQVLDTEVAALRQLSPHPNICQFVAFYNHPDDQYCYLAMEWVQGGELFEHLVQHGSFSESDAAAYIRQFAEALCHCHAHGWAHGDLKPENVCLSGGGTKQTVKLIDFGCATRTTTVDPLPSVTLTPSTMTTASDGESSSPATNTSPPPLLPASSLGTIAYMAPELFRRGATPTPAADMWAAGCIVYIVLTGSHPLDMSNRSTDDEMASILRSIEGSKDVQQQQEWVRHHIMDERVQYLTPSAVEVLKGLFEPDPAKRMNSKDFCKHPWVQGLTASWKTLEDIDQKLEAFWHNAFRNEILRRFASANNKNKKQGSNRGSNSKKMTLSDENLLQIFHALDINGDGVLQYSEVEAILRDLGAQDVPKTFAHMDLDNSGVVRWEEFCAIMRRQFHNGPGVRTRYRQQRFQTAILKHFGVDKSAVSQHRLREFFNALDLDGNGVLDAHEIRVVLRSIGESDENISQIVAAIDVNHDGKVDWREFRAAMMKRHS